MASGLFQDPMINPRLAVTKLICKYLTATWSQVATSSRPGATCLDFGPFSEPPAGSDNSRKGSTDEEDHTIYSYAV